MEAIRIKKRIESDTLVLPVLKKMIGKDVEIILLVEPDQNKFSEKNYTLEEFFGSWKDDRDTEKIISEIYESRRANIRSEKVKF